MGSAALATLAFVSGALQALGYVLYLRGVMREEITPNPTSWAMFAYGTASIVVLEIGNAARWDELVLPLTCALASIAVAVMAWRGPSARESVPTVDRVILGLDLFLTAIYVGLLGGHTVGVIEASTLERASTLLLVCANATEITCSFPIIRSTYEQPSNERPAPWLTWSAAYAVLLIVTLGERSPGALLLYPATSLFVHLLIGGLSLWRRRQSGGRDQSAASRLFVAPTETKGFGVYTRMPYLRQELVLRLDGEERHFASRTQAHAHDNPNWIGLDKDWWLEPTGYAAFLNHSCEPNLGFLNPRELVALRNIRAGEEVTFDYTVSEDEPLWQMACTCGAPSCRRVIRAVQFLPEEVWRKRLPFVTPYFRGVRQAHVLAAAAAASSDELVPSAFANPAVSR